MLQDIDKAYIAGFLDNLDFIDTKETTRDNGRIRLRYSGKIRSEYDYCLLLIQLRYGGNIKIRNNKYKELKMGPAELGFMLEDLFDFTSRREYWEPLIEWHRIRQDNINSPLSDFYLDCRNKIKANKNSFEPIPPNSLLKQEIHNSYLGGVIDGGVYSFLNGFKPIINFSTKNPIFLNYINTQKWSTNTFCKSQYFNEKIKFEEILIKLAELSRAKKEYFHDCLKIFKNIIYGDKNLDKIEQYKNRKDIQSKPCICSCCNCIFPETFMKNSYYCEVCQKQKSKIYYEENKLECISRVRNWQKNNNWKYKHFSSKFRKRLKKLVGSCSLRKNDLIGCSPVELKNYLELLWAEGMSWDNYGWGEGKWVIDHIVPIAAFNLENEKEIKKCFHYTNLRPLWFKDNESKSDLLENGQRGRDIIK